MDSTGTDIFGHIPALAKPYEQEQLQELLLACMFKPAQP